MKNFYAVGVMLILFAAVSCERHKSSVPASVSPPKYPTAIVSSGVAEQLNVYPATVRGREDIEIRPRIDGFIDNIFIDEGSEVSRGQILFKINSPHAEQAVTVARAAVTAVKAQVATAKLNVDRMAPLAEKGIISPVQLDTYRNAHASAEASLAQAQAQLTNAEATLSWTSVTSPVNGHVGAIVYRRGSLVNSQNVLTTVANTATVFAYFSMNEKALAEFLGRFEGSTHVEKLRHAPEVSLTLADGTAYPRKGKIETITGVVNVATGSVSLRAEFPNDEGKLRSGMSGRISIPYHYDNVIMIPQKSTFAQQNKVLVYVVDGSAARQRVVEVEPMPDGQAYIVHSGLTAGERIVTDGIATLRDGIEIAFDK